MLHNVQKGAFLLFLSSLTLFGMTGCDDNDPNYDHVVPPKVEIQPNTLSGVITAKTGAPIKGATVALGGNIMETDADGVYLFKNVAEGTYPIKVTANGKVPAFGDLEVKNIKHTTQHFVWNASLAADVKKDINVEAGKPTRGSIVTEALKDNKKAAVKIDFSLIADGIEAVQGTKISLAPVYSSQVTEQTRAANPTLMVGINLSCTDGSAQLKQPMQLVFHLDESMVKEAKAMMLINDAWQPAESKISGNNLVVTAKEFTGYALFLNVTFSQRQKEVLDILDERVDNLYGTREVYVGDLNYTYMVGKDSLPTANSILEALLLEKVVLQSSVKMDTLNVVYPINKNLPVGTMMIAKGYQPINNVKAAYKKAAVTAAKYGNAKVNVQIINRDHSGGTD